MVFSNRECFSASDSLLEQEVASPDAQLLLGFPTASHLKFTEATKSTKALFQVLLTTAAEVPWLFL